MPKRSITDEEIGLIKAMLARGMANKDIQFYFNRQDRAVRRLNQIRERAVGQISTSARAKEVMDAMTGLKEADADVFEYANELVGQCLEFWADDRNLVTYIRKAASRLDELIYGPLVPE